MKTNEAITFGQAGIVEESHFAQLNCAKKKKKVAKRLDVACADSLSRLVLFSPVHISDLTFI